MRQRALGTSGLTVSEIGLGAWQLGDRGWNGPEEDESIRIVHRALALGCTFFDTAPPYADGRSERLLGQALEGRRDEAVICTKFGYSAESRQDFGADQIERSVEDSLRRLRTDYLDILLLHSPPPALMSGDAPHYAVLRRLKDAGVIRAYGVSLRAGDCAELRQVIETTDSDVVEVRFNVLCQEPAPAIAEAQARGVGVIVNVPLESGWLSGKYNATSTFDPVRSRWSTEDITRKARLVRQFEELLPPGVRPAAAALQFILAQQGVSTTIPGAKSVTQLEQNLLAANATLPPETITAIHHLWTTELSQDPVPW